MKIILFSIFLLVFLSLFGCTTRQPTLSRRQFIDYGAQTQNYETTNISYFDTVLMATNTETKEAQASQQKLETEKHDAVVPNYNPLSNSEYKSVLGRLFIGQALYNKGTHSPFGFVVDIDWGYVWVADSYSSRGENLQLYARKYSRSFITDNFETK